MSAPLPNLPLPAHTDRNSLRPVLDRIAGTTVMYLQQGDYLSEGEATPLLAAYGEKTHNLGVAHVKAAAKDAEMGSASSLPLKLRRWGWAMAGVTAGLSLLAYLSWHAPGMQATPVLPLPLPAAKTTIPVQPVAVTPVEPAMADASIPDSTNWIRNEPASTFVILVLTAKDANDASALL